MNDLISIQSDLTVLSSMPTKDLRAELARGLTMTASTLTKLGMVWAELERRGEDLSSLRIGIARTLPLIASGRLAAESVVAFAGRPVVLRAIEGLPLDVQRRLADGEMIPIYLPGESQPKAMPLSRVPSAAVNKVIADGVVRTPAEQRLAIRTKNKTAPEETYRQYHVTIDRERGLVKIGKMNVPLATILAAMAEAAGVKGLVIDSVEAPAKTVAGKVTDDEKERLRAAAKAHGLEEWEMVRRAVVAMWLL